MDNTELQKFYVLAKVLGYDKSFDTFKETFQNMYQNEFPPQNGTVKPVINPFRSGS